MTMSSSHVEFLLWLMLLLGCLRDCNAVYCWKKRFANGTCTGLSSWRVSETKCCEAGGEGVGFSSEFQANDIFKMVFVRTTKCSLCRGKDCSSIACGASKRCVQTAQGSPQCVCAPDCSKSYRGTVCGSDGLTHRSECEMQRKGCRDGTKLTIEYRSKCRASCQGVRCPNGKICIPGRDSRSFCIQHQCPAKCRPSQAIQLLCGADGVTYRNQCHLKREGCRQSRHIVVAYLGSCRATSSCASILCPTGKHCMLDTNNKPRCIFCDCISADFSTRRCGSISNKNRIWCNKCKTECRQRRMARQTAAGASLSAGDTTP